MRSRSISLTARPQDAVGLKMGVRRQPVPSGAVPLEVDPVTLASIRAKVGQSAIHQTPESLAFRCGQIHRWPYTAPRVRLGVLYFTTYYRDHLSTAHHGPIPGVP